MSAVLSSAPPPSVILTVTVQTVAALHSLPIYSDQSRVAFFIWFTTVKFNKLEFKRRGGRQIKSDGPILDGQPGK